MKAVFFDRDGTLIVDKHYMHKIEDLEYYPDTFEVLKEIQSLGYETFIVTNQSGIGRGMFTEEQMHAVHEQMQKDCETNGIKKYKDIKFCPQHPEEENNFRKPHPQMLNELCEKWDIDRANSFMIGDKIIDAECGLNAQIQGVWLNEKKDDRFPSVKSLTEFLEYIKNA